MIEKEPLQSTLDPELKKTKGVLLCQVEIEQDPWGEAPEQDVAQVSALKPECRVMNIAVLAVGWVAEVLDEVGAEAGAPGLAHGGRTRPYHSPTLWMNGRCSSRRHHTLNMRSNRFKTD